MPQSLSAVYVHFVFSTKDRVPSFASASLRANLHAYIASVSGQLDCPAIEVGGVADHVHVLTRMSREVSQAEWIKEVKRVSSRLMKTQGREHENFQWQGGYAAFSVSQSNVARASDYVAKQESHHARFDYRAELETLLRRHGVEWDQRHLWD